MTSSQDMSDRGLLAMLLRDYSVEVTTGDEASIEAACAQLPLGAEVFVASLPSDTSEGQLSTAVRLMRAGLIPVPHLVARNIKNTTAFDLALQRLTSEAGVDRALILAGDREHAAGDLYSSLQLLETGLLHKHGIRKIFLSCYPEHHPRITAGELVAARTAKLAVAKQAGLDVTLVSQFCFEAAPIIATAQQVRSEGVTVPIRVGVAGPASRLSLLKYALICGVGASIRALQERPAARGLLAADTPEELLTDVARATSANARLGIQGVHFFTFAALSKTIRFIAAHGGLGHRM